MRRAIVIQTFSSSIIAHCNHINVRKVVTATSRPHQFDRPKLPLTNESQWMPWCITIRRLLAIPKLQNQDGQFAIRLYILKHKSLPGTSCSAPLHWASTQTNVLVP